ncbi:molybdopterin oxidoreductase family protein [Vibrio gallaecicus]|uniref:molybdopterin oxidoreductase family protein n=1 Tax=Vibrio gallaecicus TaxID=552386 RepID=UPI0010CA08A6|nr:nitrate reductase [Vibrio gallaecicus]MDN3617555.1 nitrate reductase [Vibrio gallaecicus]
MTSSQQEWIKSTCAYCGVGCGIEARPTSSGKLEIRGDKQHPSNYGKLCTKGAALGDTVTPIGRMLYPTLASAGGGNTFAWDEATELIADKFSQTIKENGPDSVAFYVSGQLLTEDYYVANKLMKGFIGSGNIDSNSRLCMASSVVGHKRAFGSDTVPVCYEDLEQTDLVVITGSNLAWCHPVLFQRLRAAKQANQNLKVIVIDPRVTETCDIADHHLAIQSGSDVALFNGLFSYLEEKGYLDQNYIDQFTEGFNKAMKPAAKQAETREATEQITGLTSQELESFYEAFSRTNKVITIYSQGVNQSSQGCDKVNAIINCHLATGKIGKQGMGPFSVTGQPNAMGGREVGGLANTLASHFEFGDAQAHQLISDFWQTDNLAEQAGLKAIDLFDAMHEGKIKAVWIMATNPVVSLPDSVKVKEALERCPFVVVSDCIEDTETTRLANVLLPAQGWSEKSGTVTNSERRISRQRRILPSPGEAKPDWWMISQVAQKMGFLEQFDYLHEGQIFNEYCRMTSLENLDGKQRDLCLIGLTQLDDQSYSRLTPQQWPVMKLQMDSTNQRMFTDNQFFTVSGKAQFVPVEHQDPIASISSEYPLLMNTGRIRDQWHTMSRTGLAADLGEHIPEPFIAVHPDTVSLLGLHPDVSNQSNSQQILNGLKQPQVVRVKSQQGECQARLMVTKDVQPEQVFMPIHWNGTTAKDTKPCDLILPNVDSASGQPEFKHTPIMLEACGYKSEAALISESILDCDEFDYWVRQRVERGFLYRISSHKNPMALVIDLANKLDTLSTDNSSRSKTLHFHGEGGELGKDPMQSVTGRHDLREKSFGTAKLASTGMQQAFVVSGQLSQQKIDWLIDCFNKPIEEDFESEFLQQLAFGD